MVERRGGPGGRDRVAPSFDPIPLDDLVEGSVDELLEPHADVEGRDYAVDGADLDLRSVAVFGSRISGLGGTTTLRDVRLAEVVVERSDVTVLRASGALWRDVEWRASRVGSAELHDSEWRAVRFVGCRLAFVNLRGSDLEDVAFEDCVIDELDLVQATALRVAFPGTTIGRLDLQHASLRHVDLRGAELRELAGVEAMSGTIVSPAQLADLAPILAANLGITIAD